MKIEGLLIAVLMTTCAGAAFAQAEQPAPAATQEEAPKPEKKICRTERLTGSLTRSSRTCLTQAQWDQVNEQNSKSINDLSKANARGDLMNSNRPVGQ